MGTNDMQICYQCGEKLHSENQRIPARANGKFVVKYYCRNNHTGTIKGKADTDQSQWAHSGEIWNPNKRVDVPDDV